MYNRCGFRIQFPQGVTPVMNPFATLMQTSDARTDTLIQDLIPLFKAHSRITWAFDDALISLYLESAISRIEQWAFLPIRAATFIYEIPSEYQNYDKYVLPLRNCNTQGEWYGFETLIAPVVIDAPAAWPISLEVGFLNGQSVPSDLKLAIFELALALYEHRSNTTMQDVYAADIMAGNLSRYWVPRC